MAKRASFWSREGLRGGEGAIPETSPQDGDRVETRKPGKRPSQAARRKATMTDVARLAGVSQTSVSLILNNTISARISPSTRERVIVTAREIGYELPRARQAFASPPRRNVIAYIVDEISTSPHPVVSFDGARDAAWENGFLVCAHVTRSNPEIEAMTVEAILRDPSVVGIVYSTIFTRRVTPPPALRALPLALLNCHSADRSTPSIVPGEVAGAFAATRYLISKGHRRIGFINGEPWMEASVDRLKGYRQAIAAADIAFDPGLLRSGDWLPLQGHRLAGELLALPDAPTAIFCGNDLMAMGALEAAHKRGLRVPEDLSIMGYDDQELARYTHPPLSTIVLPNYEMGRRAAELVIEIAGRKTPARPTITRIAGPLIERGSVAEPALRRLGVKT
jgi:LacI family transcriptional regulator